MHYFCSGRQFNDRYFLGEVHPLNFGISIFEIKLSNMINWAFLLLLGVTLAVLARYRRPVEKGWLCDQGALRTTTIILCLLLNCLGMIQLQAARLVLVVVDEHAAPVAGMEVIHTDLNGLKEIGVYDPKAGVYRFGDLVDGAGSVTAYRQDYRLAGVRWFLHTPDTVRIVSVKGGYLLYEERGVTYWFETDNRKVFLIGGAYDLIDSLGFQLTPNGRARVLKSGKALNPMESPELALVRAKGVEWSGVIVKIAKIKKGSEELRVPYQDYPDSDPEFVGNRLKVSMHYLRAMTPEEQCAHLESLFKKYGLTLDPNTYGNPVTMVQANELDPFNYDVVLNYGVGTCIVDQIRYMLDDTYFARVNFADYHQNTLHGK
jgi:hypothetical protein